MGYREGRWAISHISESRDDALNEAKKIASSKHTKSTAVLEEFTDTLADRTVATVIYRSGDTSVADPIGKRASYKPRPGLKSPTPVNEAFKQNEKPEIAVDPKGLVTKLINQIIGTILLLGGLSLGVMAMAWYYLSHPEVFSSLIDTLPKG